MKTLPKVLFIARKESGTDNEWLQAEECLKAHADSESKVLVGKYVLEETLQVEMELKTTVKPNRK